VSPRERKTIARTWARPGFQAAPTAEPWTNLINELMVPLKGDSNVQEYGWTTSTAPFVQFAGFTMNEWYQRYQNAGSCINLDIRGWSVHILTHQQPRRPAHFKISRGYCPAKNRLPTIAFFIWTKPPTISTHFLIWFYSRPICLFSKSTSFTLAGCESVAVVNHFIVCWFLFELKVTKNKKYINKRRLKYQ
jgi:hypothetical protein